MNYVISNVCGVVILPLGQQYSLVVKGFPYGNKCLQAMQVPYVKIFFLASKYITCNVSVIGNRVLVLTKNSSMSYVLLY